MIVSERNFLERSEGQAKKEKELRTPVEGRDQFVWESRVHSSVNFGRPYDELAGLHPPVQDDEGYEPRLSGSAAGSGDFLGVEFRGEDAREADVQAELVAVSASADWLRDADQNRERLREEARAAAGEGSLRVGRTLRQTWQSAQCADPALLPWMKPTASRPEGLRLAEDGLLERSVRVRGTDVAIWVPVVPDGRATVNLSWKKWVFLQTHVGALGGHRPADKAYVLIERIC